MLDEKEFLNASLQFKTIGSDDKVKNALTLQSLAENASNEQVLAVRDALQTIFVEPIAETLAIETYSIN